MDGSFASVIADFSVLSSLLAKVNLELRIL